VAEVTVRQSLAAHYQARKQPSVTLAHLLAAQQSLARAELGVTAAREQDAAVYEASCRAIGRLRIQLWLAEANARQLLRQRREALAVLQQAVAMAEYLTAEPLGVEAGRQLGDALSQAGLTKAARETYHRALCMAEQLGADSPPASTQAVGEACLRLADTAPARQAVRVRLEQLSALR
jgi:tetratricopeptide (TPR) repeat protein